MNRSWIPRLALLALMLASTATLAFADIPNPNNRGASKSDLKTHLQIQTDDKVKEAKLVIPRSLLQQMQAQLDGGNPQTASAAARFFNMSGAQTVLSGIFLSLAFVMGGLWLVRARRRAERIPARAVALTLSLVLVGGITAGVAYANAGPPPVARSLTSKILIPELQWWGAGGEVTVEVVEEGDYIKLVMPRREITDKDRRQTE